MKREHLAASAVILVGLLASQAHGQAKVIVGPQQQVNPEEQQWQECSVAARLGDKNEVVVCAQGAVERGMYYAVSFDGGANFEAHTLHDRGMDSGLTVDPVSDRIWISFFGGCSHPEQCVSVAWKDPNDSEFDPFYKAAYIIDRPLMAIDPGLGGSFPGRHYLLYSGMGGPGSHPVWAAHSDAPTDPNQPLWTAVRVEPDPNDPGRDYHGWGKMPVVLSDGRVVVVNTDYEGDYNDKLPYVVYSDDAGCDWKPDLLPPVKVAEDSGIQAATRPRDVGDTPGAIDRRHCAPAIAVDRTVTPNTDVYVAFYARAEPGPLDEDRNTDIYISRSSDRGHSFPGTSAQHLLQLTDELLTGQPGGVQGPDQVMPALAIDGCGGVNLVFYDNRHDPNPADDNDWYDLYYVRITDFDTGEPSIYQARLTPESFLVSEASNFLGDYHHMAVAGPQQRTVYTAYIACPLLQPGGPGSSPEWRNNCYLHQIRIFCLSDLNLDGESDADDISLFTLAYEGQWELADLNEDGAVDEQDYALFWDVYTNGCGAR